MEKDTEALEPYPVTEEKPIPEQKEKVPKGKKKPKEDLESDSVQFELNGHKLGYTSSSTDKWLNRAQLFFLVLIGLLMVYLGLS